MLPFQRAKKLRLLDVSCRGWLPIGFRQVNNVKVARRLLYQCRSTIVSIIIPGSLNSFPSPLRTFHRKVFSTLNVSVRFSKFAKAHFTWPNRLVLKRPNIRIYCSCGSCRRWVHCGTRYTPVELVTSRVKLSKQDRQNSNTLLLFRQWIELHFWLLFGSLLVLCLNNYFAACYW